MRVVVAEDSPLFREGLIGLLLRAGHDVVASADKIPFPDGSFDLVTCQQMLHFARDRMAVLRQMRTGNSNRLRRVDQAACFWGSWAGLAGAATAAVLVL